MLRQQRCGGSGERILRRWLGRGFGEVWGYSRKIFEEIAMRMLRGPLLPGEHVNGEMVGAKSNGA